MMNCSWYKEQRITVVRIGITIGKDGLKDKGKTQSDDCGIREINLELVKCIFTSLVWNQVSQTRPCMKPGKLLEQPAPQMELNFWLSPSVPCEQELFFAVWAVMPKVASAEKRSIFYRACSKFITQFASKSNHHVCHQMARVSQE